MSKTVFVKETSAGFTFTQEQDGYDLMLIMEKDGKRYIAPTRYEDFDIIEDIVFLLCTYFRNKEDEKDGNF